MKKLTNSQLDGILLWMENNARPLDIAKLGFTLGRASKDDILRELLKYQNPDGGFGNGLECDITSPLSSAIAGGEALFTAYAYRLDTDGFSDALNGWFERSFSADNPKYWDDVPKDALDAPHAPWWSYYIPTEFTPNPSAVAASSLMTGSEAQRAIADRVIADSLDLLQSDRFCGDHDTLCMIALVERLMSVNSPLVTDEVRSALKRRIRENTAFEPSKWQEYTFMPTDFVDSPTSPWYDAVSDGIDTALDHYIDTLNADGSWTPNFSWGIDTDTAHTVTRYWKGHIAAKRVRILKNFGRI